MVAVGIVFLLAALLWDTPLGSLFCGFAGAFIVPGIIQVGKYIKWTRPKNVPIYRERLEQERIDLRDERKSMLRDKSGRYAYILGMLLAAVSIVVFSVLKIVGTIGEAEFRLMGSFLAGYLLVQYIAGLLIYRMLEEKY